MGRWTRGLAVGFGIAVWVTQGFELPVLPVRMLMVPPRWHD
jgi:hypothetical protein